MNFGTQRAISVNELEETAVPALVLHQHYKIMLETLRQMTRKDGYSMPNSKNIVLVMRMEIEAVRKDDTQ